MKRKYGNRNLIRTTILVASLFCLALEAGCAAVDTVSSRADTFNQQTADAKSASILTNIVRAAYAEPLQFTELSQTSGTGSVQGTVGSSVPFPFRGGQGLTPLQIISGTFGGQTSVGNTFTMTNLSNQDFYQGIQKPFPQQLIFSYMAEGFDPQIILNLFVSDIEVTRNGKTALISNNPDSPSDWNKFYSAVNILSQLGLEGEKTSENTPVGVDVNHATAGSDRVVAALIGSTDTSPKFDQEDGRIRLVKHDASYRYCFRPAEDKPATGPVALLTRNGVPVPKLTIMLGNADYCGASAKERSAKKSGDKIQFRTRSVEGAILYLGGLVRNQWGLGRGGPNPFQIPHSDGSYYTVFKLDRGLKAGGLLDVWYKGQNYGIARDPSGGHDGSSRVMQLLTDALALQSSSKDVPTPGLVTVIGG